MPSMGEHSVSARYGKCFFSKDKRFKPTTELPRCHKHQHHQSPILSDEMDLLRLTRSGRVKTV